MASGSPPPTAGPARCTRAAASSRASSTSARARRSATPLIKIVSGLEQEPTTAFNIYGSTIAKEFDPVFAPIAFHCDIEQRVGSFSVPGHLEMSLEPIRNPVTGKPHRAQIRLPEGFEFREAEMASGTFSGTGDIQFQNRNCYGFLTLVAYGPYGVIATS